MFLGFAYQSQLTEFRSFEGQDMYAGEKIIPIKVCLIRITISISSWPSPFIIILHLDAK